MMGMGTMDMGTKSMVMMDMVTMGTGTRSMGTKSTVKVANLILGIAAMDMPTMAMGTSSMAMMATATMGMGMKSMAMPTAMVAVTSLVFHLPEQVRLQRLTEFHIYGPVRLHLETS